jgi:hypothetical protein
MIAQHDNGYRSVIHNNDRETDFAKMRIMAATAMREGGYKYEAIAKFFNVHRNTVRAWLRVHPADITPMFGSGEWTPDVQDQKPSECNRCGGGKAIKRGSRLYCAACHKSGFDARLKEQLDKEVYCDAIEAEMELFEKGQSLAKRRKLRK